MPLQRGGLGAGRGLEGKKADAKLYHGSKTMGFQTIDPNPVGYKTIGSKTVGSRSKTMGYRTKPTRHTNHPDPRCEHRGGGAPMRRRCTQRRRRTQETQAHAGSTGAFTKRRRTQETQTPPGGAGAPRMQFRPRFCIQLFAFNGWSVYWQFQ